MSRIATAVEVAVKDRILSAIDNPASGLGSHTPGLDAADVAREVRAGLAPVITNLANAEPWYQSRVTWGAIVAVALPLARVVGVETDLVDAKSVVDVVMSVVAAAGGVYALYGRYVGRKPIGA